MIDVSLNLYTDLGDEQNFTDEMVDGIFQSLGDDIVKNYGDGELSHDGVLLGDWNMLPSDMDRDFPHPDDGKLKTVVVVTVVDDTFEEDRDVRTVLTDVRNRIKGGEESGSIYLSTLLVGTWKMDRRP